MRIQEFITFLGTKNLNNTAYFYQNVLGLKLYKDQGLCKIFNVTKESKIGFCSHMPIISADKGPILTLVVENVEEFYEKLINLGQEIPNPPKINPKFNIYHFFFYDPNGYTLEIQKFLD
ncbi:MAG: VOC family protein [Candidatus Hodarchaeota archaeon]